MQLVTQEPPARRNEDSDPPGGQALLQERSLCGKHATRVLSDEHPSKARPNLTSEGYGF